MTPNICLVAIDPNAEDALRRHLFRSALGFWRAASAKDYLADPRHDGTMCVIVDLPRGSGLKTLMALRAAKVDAPALLLADADEDLDAREIAAASVLDTLRRPLQPRELLVWLECILLTLMALVRERVRRGLPAMHAA